MCYDDVLHKSTFYLLFCFQHTSDTYLVFVVRLSLPVQVIDLERFVSKLIYNVLMGSLHSLISDTTRCVAGNMERIRRCIRLIKPANTVQCMCL